MPQLQSLDELFRQVEDEGIAKAKILIAAEAPLVAARLKAQEEARKTIPVWIVYDNQFTGPYENDDAAVVYMEAQNIPSHEALVVDSEDAARECLKGEDDDDEEDE